MKVFVQARKRGEEGRREARTRERERDGESASTRPDVQRAAAEAERADEGATSAA